MAVARSRGARGRRGLVRADRGTVPRARTRAACHPLLPRAPAL